MSQSLLGDLLGNLGAPFLKSIVEGALPPPLDKLGGRAVDVIAGQLGVEPTPEAIVDAHQADPGRVTEVVTLLEASPEMILAGVEQQKATNELFRLEQESGPLWTWAWRPAGMWGLGFFWLWNIVLLHVFNAIFKIALPVTDLWLLFQLSGIYMGLYMGGHTIKDFVAKRWGGAA